jgi:hypothetical protein
MFAGRIVAQGTPLPDYVQREFKDHLKCSRHEPGGLRANPTPNGAGARKTGLLIVRLALVSGRTRGKAE